MTIEQSTPPTNASAPQFLPFGDRSDNHQVLSAETAENTNHSAFIKGSTEAPSPTERIRVLEQSLRESRAQCKKWEKKCHRTELGKQKVLTGLHHFQQLSQQAQQTSQQSQSTQRDLEKTNQALLAEIEQLSQRLEASTLKYNHTAAQLGETRYALAHAQQDLTARNAEAAALQEENQVQDQLLTTYDELAKYTGYSKWGSSIRKQKTELAEVQQKVQRARQAP